MVAKEVGREWYRMKGAAEGKEVKTAWFMQGSYNPGPSKWQCGLGRPVGKLQGPQALDVSPATSICVFFNHGYRPRWHLPRRLLRMANSMCLSRLE